MLILKLAFEVIIFATHLSAFGALATPVHLGHELPDSPPGLKQPENPWVPDLAEVVDSPRGRNVWVWPIWNDNVFYNNDRNKPELRDIVLTDGSLHLRNLKVVTLLGIWEQLGAARSMWDNKSREPYRGLNRNQDWLSKLDQAHLERLLVDTDREICRRLQKLDEDQWRWLFYDISMMKVPGGPSWLHPPDYAGRVKWVKRLDKHMVDAFEELAHKCHDQPHP